MEFNTCANYNYSQEYDDEIDDVLEIYSRGLWRRKCLVSKLPATEPLTAVKVQAAVGPVEKRPVLDLRTVGQLFRVKP